MKTIFGASTAISGLIFLHSETVFFGGNWTPQSSAECICDGIGLLIVAIGYLIVFLPTNSTK